MTFSQPKKREKKRHSDNAHNNTFKADEFKVFNRLLT